MRTFKATGAALATLVLLVLPPVLLSTLVGNPLPPGGIAWNAPLSDAAVLGLLTALAWILWAQLALSLLSEARAIITDRPVSRRLPVFAFQQDLARALLTALFLTSTAAPLLTTALAQPAGASLPTPPPASATAAQPSAAPPAQSHHRSHTTTTRTAHHATTLNARSAHTTSEHAHTAATQADKLAKVTVTRGDTLWSLAEHHLGDGNRWTEIATVNQGRTMTDGSAFVSASLIRPGWQLLIPQQSNDPSRLVDRRAVSYPVQPGDTLWSIAESHLGAGADYPEIFRLNRGAPQPDGETLTDPDHIEPGWRLRLVEPAEPAGGRRSTAHRHETESPPEVNATPPRSDAPGTPAAATTTADERRAQPGPPALSTDRDGSRVEEKASSSLDDHNERITPLGALLATATCLAGGLLLLLTGHRARQWRDRLSGRIPARTPPHLQAAERDIVQAGSLAAGDVHFIDQALRYLAHQQRDADNPMPCLRSATLDTDYLRLRLANPDSTRPPEPWSADEDNLTWQLDRATVIDTDLIDEQPAPYPALVTVGVDDLGRAWLLDLEPVADLTISGDPTTTDDLIRYLTAELAVNPWAHGIDVLLVGDTAHELVDLDPTRISTSEPDTAARRAHLIVETAAETNAAETSALDARRDGHPDGTQPLVLIEPSDVAATADFVSGRSRLVTIRRTTDSATVTLHARDHATIVGVDVSIRPLLLGRHEADAMAALCRATRSSHDEPMPDAVGDAPTDRVSRADGSLRAELVATRQAGGDPTSLLPHPDADYLAATATTHQDLQDLAPSTPPETSDHVSRLDPTLDEDLAAWWDPNSPRPKVHILGPVSVTANGPAQDTVSRLGGTIEFIVYLACQDHGVTPERAADALRWTERTVWNRARDARRYLGQRPDGTEYLPEAPKSPGARMRGIATYELHPDVLNSGDLFRRLRLRGQARGAAGIDDLHAALALVEGEPFDQLRRGGYGWLLEGDRLDHHLTAAIIDTAHIAATNATQAGDIARALRACETAMKAAPHADGPHLDFASVREAQGDPDPDSHLQNALIEETDQDDPPVRTEHVLQRKNWLAS